ncbi:MAG: hypothetical protein HRU32_04980 [Rhodobacteraceae bacterium]|nr:hypothetical protein [Paracoccaceae bacterium]
MTRTFIAAAALLSLAACAPTPSADGSNTFVTPIGGTIKYTSASEPFSVLPRAGAGSKEYWCAAGQGADRVAPSASRLYLVQPIAPDQPAIFSLTEPPGGGAPTGIATIGGDPNSLSVSQAKALCDQVGNSRR